MKYDFNEEQKPHQNPRCIMGCPQVQGTLRVANTAAPDTAGVIILKGRGESPPLLEVLFQSPQTIAVQRALLVALAPARYFSIMVPDACCRLVCRVSHAGRSEATTTLHQHQLFTITD